MSLARWLRSAFVSPARKPRPARRLAVECLEARDNPSGGLLDPTFGDGGTAQNNPTSYSRLTDVRVLPDGKLLAAGISQGGSNTDYAVARYNADGTPDLTFGTGGATAIDFKSGNDRAMAVAVQPGTGGKILVAGTATLQGAIIFGVSRLNPDGTLDTSFGGKTAKGKVTSAPAPRVTNYATSMVVQPDGRFVLVGLSLNQGSFGFGSISLARFKADGTPDTSFGNKGVVLTTISAQNGNNAIVHSVNAALDASGRIVVSGTTPNTFMQTGDAGDFLVARFNPNGGLDSTFGGTGVVTTDLTSHSGSDSAIAMALQGDGKIVVAGATAPVNGPTWSGVVRYNPDGSLDAGFDGDGIAVIAREGQLGTQANVVPRAVAVQGDGQILLAQDVVLVPPGAVGSEDFIYQNSLMRLNADGSVDNSYGPSGDGLSAAVPGSGSPNITAMALQPDGRAVIARVGAVSAGVSVFTLTRFTASSLAPSPVQVGSFAATPNPVSAGDPLTLTAGGITTTNAGATVTKVAFYSVDAFGTEQLLGYAAPNADGTWTLSFTVNLAPGSYTLLALAVDSTGAISDPISLSLDVV